MLLHRTSSTTLCLFLHLPFISDCCISRRAWLDSRAEKFRLVSVPIPLSVFLLFFGHASRFFIFFQRSLFILRALSRLLPPPFFFRFSASRSNTTSVSSLSNIHSFPQQMCALKSLDNGQRKMIQPSSSFPVFCTHIHVVT